MARNSLTGLWFWQKERGNIGSFPFIINTKSDKGLNLLLDSKLFNTPKVIEATPIGPSCLAVWDDKE